MTDNSPVTSDLVITTDREDGQIFWRRSSFCAQGECLEVRLNGETVEMRNSSAPERGVVSWLRPNWEIFLAWVMSGFVNPDIANHQTGLGFTFAEWVAFCDGVRNGEFEVRRLEKIDKD